jgi:hypothetical protein
MDYDTSYTPHKVVDEDANKAEEQRVFFEKVVVFCLVFWVGAIASIPVIKLIQTLLD